MTQPDATKHLIDACTMFLVPASILFAAIGIARTEWLKALISGIGACVGALWLNWVWHWPESVNQLEQHTAIGLAATFCAAAIVSAVVHVIRGFAEWWRGRTNPVQLPSGSMIVFIP